MSSSCTVAVVTDKNTTSDEMYKNFMYYYEIMQHLRTWAPVVRFLIVCVCVFEGLRVCVFACEAAASHLISNKPSMDITWHMIRCECEIHQVGSGVTVSRALTDVTGHRDAINLLLRASGGITATSLMTLFSLSLRLLTSLSLYPSLLPLLPVKPPPPPVL